MSYNLGEQLLTKINWCFFAKGEVALITGGASGLGKATAEWLSNLGIAVYAIDLPEPVLKAEQERADMRKPIKFRSADVSRVGET